MARLRIRRLDFAQALIKPLAWPRAMLSKDRWTRNPFFKEVLQLDSGERPGISECWWNCKEPVLWQEIAHTSRVLG